MAAPSGPHGQPVQTWDEPQWLRDVIASSGIKLARMDRRQAALDFPEVEIEEGTA